MKAVNVLIICTLLLFKSQTGFSQTNDDLREFVFQKMSNFSSWIEDIEQDPYASYYNESGNFSSWEENVTMETVIHNLAVEGHSKRINPQYVHQCSVITKEFKVDFEMTENITFSGMHETQGKVNGTEISGKGLWYITFGTVKVRNLGIKFEENSFTSYLQVREVMPGYIFLYYIQDIYFENITDNSAVEGFQENVQRALGYGLEEYIDHGAQRQDFVRTLFGGFWEEVLEETTMANISGWTDPSLNDNNGLKTMMSSFSQYIFNY